MTPGRRKRTQRAPAAFGTRSIQPRALQFEEVFGYPFDVEGEEASKRFPKQRAGGEALGAGVHGEGTRGSNCKVESVRSGLEKAGYGVEEAEEDPD